ncbi:hypothetical protein ACWPKO_02285 [Coraliomargarita sp. W4R53]
MLISQIKYLSLILLPVGAAVATLDLDDNGISDVWQSVYADAVLSGDVDSDNDGQTDLEEAIARTNPFDADSLLELSIDAVAGAKADTHVFLQWPSEFGLKYSLYYSSALSSLNPGTLALENHVGTGSVMQLEVEKGSADQRFWRISTSGHASDLDGDQLDFWEENQLGSDPLLADSDGDFLLDGKDFAYSAGATTFSPAGLGLPTTGELAGKLVRYNKEGDQVAIRAFGVNYYDGFLRYIKDVEDRSFVDGFEYLADKDIPVARSLVGGFWPSHWNLYFSDKTEYYRRLDDYVEQAERNEVGLILVLFWTFSSIGDVVQDAVDAGYITPVADAASISSPYDFVPPSPLNQDKDGNDTYDEYRTAMARADSGTRALVTYVTEEVVNRYRDSPAIWGWEFSNEMNLSVDLPNPIPNRPQVHSSFQFDLSRDDETVPAYSSADDLLRSHLLSAKEHFAATVRSIDPWRFISSGDASQRPAAYNNWQLQSWGIGSRAELAQVIPVDNPTGYDSVSIHFYAHDENFFSDEPKVTLNVESGANRGEELVDYTTFLDFFMQESEALTKTLFVGEWGASGDGTTASERDTFHSMTQALLDSDVQLSLLWSFDNRNANQTTTWYVNPGSDKEYQLTNEDDDLWDLEQVNAEHGVW